MDNIEVGGLNDFILNELSIMDSNRKTNGKLYSNTTRYDPIIE